MDRAGQTTYSVQKWLGSENSKLFKKLPQSWSPGSKIENSSFRPRDSIFFKLSSQFSYSSVKTTSVTQIVVSLVEYLERTPI